MNDQKQKENSFLSIVMPVYNEEGVIEKVVRDFCNEALEKFDKKEFIIVNDCSKDNTLRILENLGREISYLRILNNEKNCGHGKSLRRAYENAKGDFIFHCDSDNQFKAEDFWLLYEKMKEFNLDVILGIRKERHDALHRLIITRILRILCLLVYGARIKDSNSPFKLHSRQALEKLLKIVPADCFAPSLMMAIAAKKMKMKMKEIPVHHLPRLTGKVSIIRWRLFKICLKCVAEMIKFKKDLRLLIKCQE